MKSKIRIGFVGTGWMGEQLLNKIPLNPNAEVAAVYDVNEERAKEVIERAGVDPSLYVNGYDAYHNIFGTKGGIVYDSQAKFKSMIKYWTEDTGREWIFPLDHKEERKKGHEAFLWPEDISMPASGDVLEHATKEIVNFFVEQILEGKKCYLGFDSMRIVQDVTFASQLSAAMKKPAPLPPSTEDLQRILG